MSSQPKRIEGAPATGARDWRVFAAWTVLISLAALLCYGFWTQRLFAQAIWNPDGLRRLALLCAAYSLFAAIVFRVRPTAFGALIAGGSLVCAVSAVGFGPVAAVLFLGMSAAALGDGVLRRIGGPERSLSGRGAFLLALLTGAGLISVGVSAAAHFPVNYRFVYVCALAAPLALNGASLRAPLERGWRALWTPALCSGPTFAGYALLAFVIVAHVVVALKPEVGYDALAVHLMAPAYVESHARWLFDPLQYAWSVMPLGGDWLYTAAYLLGGEFAARLTNLGALLAILALLHSFARRWLPAPAAAAAGALFASTPLVELVTGSLFIENILAAMILGAVFAIDRLRRRRDAASLAAAGILLGVSLSIKLGAVSCVVPLAIFAALAASPRGSIRWFHAAAAATVFLLIGALPYLYAWKRAGSPLYPFVPSIFSSPFPGKFPPAWDSLYRMTFRSHEYLESQDGSFGFHYLLFAPAALALLFLRRVPYAVRVAGTAALVSAIAVTGFQPYLRYLYPAMALFSVVICAILAALLRFSRALYRSVAAAAVLCILLNIYFLPASGWYQKNFFLPPPFGVSADNARTYVMAMAPARGIIDYLNLKRRGQPAWFIGTNNIAGLAGRAYAAVWHQPPFAREVAGVRSASDVLTVARRHGLRNFVAPAELSTVEPAPVREFLQQNTAVEYEFGAMALYRMRGDELFGEELLTGAQGADNWAGWQRHGAVAIDAASGAARVTNEETLLKSVPIEPSGHYRYSLEAYCATPGTLLRLQINWHDAAERFITTTIDPEPCGPRWAVYSKDLTAPDAAARGVVIIGSHTGAPVLVRSASLKD